mmetsp:Transcript_60983/g.180514  ORF Transcript_60983/g.180514 Transcript_60983/m.180514 type:complete len:123 (-) Transcript_60983:34-402(-)|eukprot:CAMPEP_0113565856 /NCGR_PEP_ID=MMETSP0015_2-20120614/22406_1 /TAXON_ID=2838 /ORGANISM="Odontella" /LENGTH=122 /DNA_ID=CAMNT_0000468093 /DNA_START=236 /DNA_END=604 /DNA_ORIENTATION=+ /assembly_acc=CAM_ASM_000160
MKNHLFQAASVITLLTRLQVDARYLRRDSQILPQRQLHHLGANGGDEMIPNDDANVHNEDENDGEDILAMTVQEQQEKSESEEIKSEEDDEGDGEDNLFNEEQHGNGSRRRHNENGKGSGDN